MARYPKGWNSTMPIPLKKEKKEKVDSYALKRAQKSLILHTKNMNIYLALLEESKEKIKLLEQTIEEELKKKQSEESESEEEEEEIPWWKVNEAKKQAEADEEQRLYNIDYARREKIYQEEQASMKAAKKVAVVVEPPLTPVNEDYEEARKLAMMSEEEELAYSRSMRGYPNILPAPDKPMTKPKREVKRAIGQNIQLYPIPPLEG